MDTIAIAHVNNAPPHSVAGDWDRTYRSLPDLFFGLAILWSFLVVVWTSNTWSKRRWQTSNLQWVLTVIPAMKSLVMGLSFVFWYSCLHLKTCSFWVAFGVFVSRIFFETACFVTFLLISYGYCIMHEQLSLTERRTVAGLTSLLYLTLTGYKAAVPQFAVLIIFIYAVLLYVIMAHIARNLSLLREQLQQIQAEGVHMMQNAVHTKYTMFRKFQGAILAMVVLEILMHAQAESVVNEYWVRLLVREVTEVTIFFFIGWTFRSREQTPFFNVMPRSNTAGQRTLAPIYSVEMNERQFSKLDYKEWHIGVPTSLSRTGDGNRSMLVIVQNPGVSDFAFTEKFGNEPIQNANVFKLPATFQQSWPDPSSSSMTEHEGLQLRLRATGELSTTVSGNRKDSHASDYCHWDSKCHKDLDGNAGGYTEEVAVDMKGLRSFTFLPFENPCCDTRPLHSRSNLSKSLQTNSVHYQSNNTK
ncbi:hypothetical protein KC19_5G198800 [Ceratodon purpureus]|uniref:Transmembrane protein n=1 Tax=Ceratodon purpureus TaxID=3225 RepID=A0A8T0I4W6_CERPU|nr:hypothetical protein KC19_5G198800 [Ceratodon purpureus]